MTDLQHKQNLMATIATSLIQNRQDNSGNLFGRYNSISQSDINNLADDCERIVKAIVKRAQRTEHVNIPTGTKIFVVKE